jgi:hypothetical protein
VGENTWIFYDTLVSAACWENDRRDVVAMQAVSTLPIL